MQIVSRQKFSDCMDRPMLCDWFGVHWDYMLNFPVCVIKDCKCYSLLSDTLYYLIYFLSYKRNAEILFLTYLAE